MRNLKIILTMILAMLCISPLTSAQTKTPVSSSYDKFKDQTTVAGTVHLFNCDTEVISMHTDMIAGYRFSGTALSTIPDNIILIFRNFTVSTSDKRTMKNGDEWIFLLDGKERLSVGNVSVKNSGIKLMGRPNNFIQQSASASMSYKDFKKLASAKSIELQIGNLEYSAPKNEFLQNSLPLFKELDTTISKAIEK